MIRLVPCVGCGGLFPEADGPTHPYLESSPGCAAACGEVFACHYSEMPSFADVYRLANDAYAVQHPGGTSRRAIQSVVIHLIRLCLVFEHNLPPERANDAVLAAGRRKSEFTWLERPATMGGSLWPISGQGLSTGENGELVRRWAREAYSAWSMHHATIRRWLPEGFA
ncbi:MAG: DUF5946 family protein [Isosphaeraceae bacterium]